MSKSLVFQNLQSNKNDFRQSYWPHIPSASLCYKHPHPPLSHSPSFVQLLESAHQRCRCLSLTSFSICWSSSFVLVSMCVLMKGFYTIFSRWTLVFYSFLLQSINRFCRIVHVNRQKRHSSKYDVGRFLGQTLLGDSADDTSNILYRPKR